MSERQSKNLVVLVLLLPVYWWQVLHHVAWRDEYNAWAIAFVSHSLGELMHRVRYEAHPALWYVLCYGASRISHAAWMLRVLQGVVGTGIFAAIALLSPFVWWEVALVLGGFYVSFHYTVLARMYGLELLFAVLYAWRRVRSPETLVRNALWLALLVNTESTGGILACGLLVEMALERTQAIGRRAWGQIAGAVGVFAAGCAVSLASFWPAKDIGWSSTGKLFQYAFSGEHIGSSFGKWTGLAFFPTTVNTQNLWVDPEPWPHALLLPLALGLLIAVFWKRWRVGALFLTVAVVGMVFADVTNVSGVRHYGVEFIAFLCAMWIWRAEGHPMPRAAVALFGLLVVATLHNAAIQWHRPYADDEDAANWLRAQGMSGRPLIGSPDTMIIGVPERLDKPVFQLECGCWDPVLTFSQRRDALHWMTDVSPYLARAVATVGSPAVFLSNRALSGQEQGELAAAGVSVSAPQVFDRGYVDDEHFFVYQVKSVR